MAPRRLVRRRRRATLALLLVAALVLGFTGVLWLLKGPTTTTTPGGSGVASSTTAPTASLGPTESPGATGLMPTSAASTQTSVASAPPSQSSSAATITFNDLKLDPSIDPAGTARTFTFVSDGPGRVSAHVVMTSLNDSSVMCVTQDALAAKCFTATTPSFADLAPAGQTHWKVTLRSMNESSPTVDVALSWPTEKPTITASDCRFQGSPNPDTLRSLAATFKPRVDGNVALDAAWPPAVVHATLALTDVTGPNPSRVDSTIYAAAGSVSPRYSHAVASGKSYQISLFNDSADAGRPNLTATIAFP